ncbi:hypothetical protein BLNAU_4900 [Blattamonas nauphoetae]|uniref:Uncharacterized protein n=1 Tax=Blattamonas nauphoetae TaxID=2049346 RepID=A0ABQ9Y8C9_9EUKA|nr:hypothetical protein BLNAU_4900 [Blattamonas nauphoetae]
MIPSLLSAVKNLLETHSLEIVRDVYFDWKEWVTMMETIEKDATLGTDLSFLQSRCLRSTLLSLQTKYQHIVHISHIEEQSLTESVSDNLSTFTTHPPTEIEATWHLSVNDSSQSLLSPSISTQTSLPTSDSSTVTVDFTRHNYQRLLVAIHHHLARPQNTVFLWDIRPSESVDTSFPAPHPSFVDKNEKFETSLFDETDDAKLIASFHRCRAVLNATKSTKCIVHLRPFKNRLIEGLHSSNLLVQSESSFLFFTIADYLPTADNPRDPQFLGIQKAFRDGTHWEKVALLELWGRWFVRGRDGDGNLPNASGFDFEGVLEADLANTHLFDQVCRLVKAILNTKIDSMSFGEKLDFLLSFEKRHRIVSRLSSNPKVRVRHERTAPDRRPLATSFGSLLSVFRGCDFPSALTEFITNDNNTIPPQSSKQVNPVFFLNHTSIDTKHRHSFFPMDLMFERYFRSDPDAFLRAWPDLSVITSGRFLFTFPIGLHSLLLRCPKFNLDQHALHQLISLFFIKLSDQDTTRTDILDLFRAFPPPRLIDSLLSLPHLVRATSDTWGHFLNLFRSFGASTCPFGSCSSLATVFKMLTPFASNPKPDELDLLSKVGETVVSLHWLSVPAHFDSPLICHLPSLSGRQRDILRHLSSPSVMPSFRDRVTIVSVSVRLLASHEFHHLQVGLGLVDYLFRDILSPTPALVSVLFEFFYRFVRMSSDPVRMNLVEFGLLDLIVSAVSRSSFLDDYEKGVAVIGILLDTIRRDFLKRSMRRDTPSMMWMVVPNFVVLCRQACRAQKEEGKKTERTSAEQERSAQQRKKPKYLTKGTDTETVSLLSGQSGRLSVAGSINSLSSEFGEEEKQKERYGTLTPTSLATSTTEAEEGKAGGEGEGDGDERSGRGWEEREPAFDSGLFVHLVIDTIEYVLGCVSNTASYLPVGSVLRLPVDSGGSEGACVWVSDWDASVDWSDGGCAVWDGRAECVPALSSAALGGVHEQVLCGGGEGVGRTRSGTRTPHRAATLPTIDPLQEPFLKFDPNSELSFEDKSVVFCSLVALVKAEHPFDNALQDRSVRFLNSLSPMFFELESTAKLVTELVPSSAGSPSGFVDGIVTLVSSPHSTMVTTALSFLMYTTLFSLPAIRLRFVESDLVIKLLATVRPHTLPISGNETMLNDLVWIINNCLNLTRQDYLINLDITDAIDKYNHREMIFQKVILPSSHFLTFLISNRYVLSRDLCKSFMSLLGTFIEMGPFHRPTLEFVLAFPIAMALPSCHSFVEIDVNIWNPLNGILNSLDDWKNDEPEATKLGNK